MSVRELKMAETRKKLIQVARRAFGEYGYAETSMDKLTAEAGLTRGALYHHFGDKKGLFAAVVDQIDSEMASSAQQHLEQPDNLWEGLMLEGRTYIEHALNAEFQRIVLRDGPAHSLVVVKTRMVLSLYAVTIVLNQALADVKNVMKIHHVVLMA